MVCKVYTIKEGVTKCEDKNVNVSEEETLKHGKGRDKASAGITIIRNFKIFKFPDWSCNALFIKDMQERRRK